MKLTKPRPPYAPSCSPAERAFTSVPNLQDALKPREVRALASVCSTLNAVADDPYLWRNYLAQELNQHRYVLQYPVDTQAEQERDITAKPYKEIYRGYKILNGQQAPLVLVANRDRVQQVAVERAKRFLEAILKKT